MNIQELRVIVTRLHETFYDAGLIEGRYDEHFEGLVFEDVSLTEEDGKVVVTVTLGEEMTAEGVYAVLDNGTLTLEDLQTYDAEAIAESARNSYDPLDGEELVEELDAKARELVGSDNYDIRYELSRFIDADVVSDYYAHRREELQD